MSSCRDLGSSGDSQAGISDRSLAAIKLFETLAVVLKELIFWLEYCDIFSFSQVRIPVLQMIDDGVGRLLEFLRAEEKRGVLCNLTDA